MKNLATKLAALGVTLALASLPLAACGNTNNSGAGTDAGDTAPAATQASPIDPSAWATMADALSVADGETVSYSYDANTFICVFTAGDSQIRTVTKADEDKLQEFANLDSMADDYIDQVISVIGDFELLSAEDISGSKLSEEEVSGLVGKTGQELIDEGFVFEYYNMYGGEQTGASMGKGYYSYDITFDAHVSEDQTEDEGAAIMGATVVEAYGFGNLSNAALDIESVK